jgi:hypothetical protein
MNQGGIARQGEGINIKRNSMHPDVYTYSGNAEKAFNYTKNPASKGVDFKKFRARDNQMYYINDGNNLEEKEEPGFLEKMIHMNVVPNNKRLITTLQKVIDEYGSTGCFNVSAK